MEKEIITLITGADKGMGFEIAKQLGEAGQHVLLGSRNRDNGIKAVNTLKKLNIKVHLIIIDVTDVETVNKAKQEIQKSYGYLSTLINNAGVALDDWKNPVDISIDAIRKDFDVNYFGLIQVTQTMLPLLKQAENAQIINISSAVGSLTKASTPGNSIYDHYAVGYQCSKAAVNMWTIDLAKTLKPEHIAVNAVNPGWVKTNFAGDKAGALTPAEGVQRTVELAKKSEFGETGTFSDVNGIVPW